MVTLRIDPSAARGAAVSQVFEEVKFIPLETNKESLFGAINQLEVTDDHYIIHDYDTKAVLIFNKNGKYISKINASKIEKDPDDKNSQDFWGFQLKTENNQIYIQIYAGKKILYFDLKGQLFKKVLPTADAQDSYRKKFSDGTEVNQYYIDKKEKDSKDSTFYNLALVKDKKKVAAYFQFHPDSGKNDENWSGNRLFDSGIPNEFFYKISYRSDIYRLTSTKLSLAYHIIFPAINSLPMDYGTNPIYRGKRGVFFSNNKKAFYSIDNIFQIGDNLHFNGRSYEYNHADKKAFIYNLKSKQLTSAADIEPDSLSQFLPVNDGGTGYDFISRGYHLFKNGYFYNSYSSLAIFAYKEKNEGKNRKYDALLTEYFKTQDRKSNPIIIQLKPKKN